MLEPTVYGLGVLVAIIGGTAAGILALLSWRSVQRTPFEGVAAILSLSLVGVIVYHVAVVVSGESLALETLRSLNHTGIALFVWFVIALHWQIQGGVSGG